ncbi:fumarylacetoacetate hydrolase family protein [Xylogone sp. PMI_703]|nr:fumarylacetoacetate hydrolase family protein [Xylogone sp. PMI_703]
MAGFQRLIRFEDSEGTVHYGEVDTTGYLQEDLVGLEVSIYEGSEPWSADFRLTEKRSKIAKVLCPLSSTPIVVGIGINYKSHAIEGGFIIPDYPVVFTKFADCLAGPYEDIPIHKEALHLDYEGEFCIIISKTCKNLTESDDPLDYVLGYTVGNDVSSRFWQTDPKRSGNQNCYPKSFDKFAPIGPIICSTDAIPDPSKLTMRTLVNGIEKQKTGLDELIFDVGTILRHLTRGMTLRQGTVIMTGTPNGVAVFAKPPAWLQDGDVVEVKIDGIGNIKNRMVFAK